MFRQLTRGECFTVTIVTKFSSDDLNQHFAVELIRHLWDRSRQHPHSLWETQKWVWVWLYQLLMSLHYRICAACAALWAVVVPSGKSAAGRVFDLCTHTVFLTAAA